MPEIKRSDNRGVYSPSTEDVLSRPPNWLVRYGLSFFFVALTLILMGTYLIKYPEIVSAPVRISSSLPPAFLVAPVSGKVEQMFTKDKAYVEEGKPLILIHNTANYNDVSKLCLCLEKEIDDFLGCLSNNSQLQLGDLQFAYAALLESSQNYKFFYETDYHNRKIANIQKQIDQYEELNQTLQEQAYTQKSDLELTKKKYRIDSSLLAESVISDLDKDASKSLLLQKKNAWLQSRSTQISTALQKEELLKTQLELVVEARDQKQKLLTDLNNKIAQLKSEIKNWEQKYLIKSPINGNVALHFINSENQNVRAGQEMLTIIPKRNETVVLASLSIVGSGQVNIGQDVNIKLNDFPFEKFGTLSGKIKGISTIARDSVYRVEISLENDDLLTSYNKKLEFRPEMSGVADIVTKDLRLIERFFYKLRKATEI